MSEPPRSPRAPSRPPPIPRAVTAAEITGAMEAVDLVEDTRTVARPDAARLVERLLELAAGEAAALLATPGGDARLAALSVRTALASWDVQGSVEQASRLLELAGPHPLAPRLRLGTALAAGDATALAQAEAGVAAMPPGRERLALALDVAEAWLWRHRDPGRAAAALDGALAALEGPDGAGGPAAWRRHARDLAALAHAGQGRWDRVIELRRADLGPDAAPEEHAHVAALLLDRGGDPAAALAACLDALAGAPPAPAGAALGWLRVVDVALGAAVRAASDHVVELLGRRAELLAGLPDAAVEAHATRHLLAAALARRGDAAAGAALFLELAGADVAAAPAVARHVAWLAAAVTAAGAAPRAELAARRALAEHGAGAVAAAHAWRALELAHGQGEAPDDVRALALAVAATDAPGARRWLDLLDLAAPTAETVARRVARGGLSARGAAALAEAGAGDPRRAAALWAACASAPADERLGTEADHRARLARAPLDAEQLAAAYAAWAAEEPVPARAAALWTARGVVDLARADLAEAERALRRAVALVPDDPFGLAALAAVLRAGERHAELAEVLGALAEALAGLDARADARRERAALLVEHLADRGGARAELDRALAERPDDGEACAALASLLGSDDAADAARALELRRRAAGLVAPGPRRAAVLVDLAAGLERVGDLDEALAALERAAEEDPARPEIGRERVRLLRGAGRLDEALAALRVELAGGPAPPRRAQLQREVAALLTDQGRDPAGALAAHLAVLAVVPDDAEALAGVEARARELGDWDALARACRAASPSPARLAVLAEALGHLGAWRELAAVRERQLALASAPAERARLAGDLAGVLERELGDVDGAVRALRVATAAAEAAGGGADVEAPAGELRRVLRAAGRWAELADALERAVAGAPAGPSERGRALLLELGAVRATQLERPADAARAYEDLLRRAPLDPDAVAALEPLYARLGRPLDLARLLEARAAAAPPGERAALLVRVAGLRLERDDVDGALAAYASAIAAEPSSREIFTAMERVCYKHERWAEAMGLYDLAIGEVEAGHSRAYRLGDLYARRAQVQQGFLGQPEAAMASYAKVLEVDSSPDAAAQALEALCVERGAPGLLVDAWERRAAVASTPARRAEALRAAARAAAGVARDPARAAEVWRQLLALEPADAEALEALERFHEARQDASGLIDVLKLHLASLPARASIGVLEKIARVSEEGARDVESAIEHYQKILEVDPDHRDALEALGRIYESTERWAELIDVTRRQIKLTTDRGVKALLYFRCGSVMEAKFGREEDAIRYYDAAIKTSSSCLPAVHGLRDLYRRREEWPRVIETLELEVKLWQDDKERAGVFAQIGRIHEQWLGDPDRAMQFYESALAVDPDCLPANQALFEHFFAHGQWDDAHRLATTLAQKAMRDGDANTRSDFYRKRGIVAERTGDARGAADSFVVALEVRPMHVEALDALGALARAQPDAWDFEGTYRELEKVYRRRDDAGPLLARVQVARAGLLARDGDLDQAAELYEAAVGQAPGDLTVLSALVDFHTDMRRWPQAISALERFRAGQGAAAPSPEDRLAAAMRQAVIHADAEMDGARAIAVLREVVAADPAHQAGHYLLAQQYFLLTRYAEARAAIDRVIDLATAPGNTLSPADLARYYYYKGRILDAAGDPRAAASQYRRATEYDPGYAPPALVLARRAADAGDQRAAEGLLIDAAHAAMAGAGPAAAVPLQRGLARILLASGDRPAAIEAYRGILGVEPGNGADRVALAEIYAVDDPARAIGELRKVIDRDLHHAPAYRLLASYYNRTGDTERAARVLTALDLLGFAEEADRATMQRLRAVRVTDPLRAPLDDEHRARWLVTPAAHDPLGEVFAALAAELTAGSPAPGLGQQLQPIQGLDEPRLRRLASEAAAVFGVEVEVFVGEKVPGLAAATAFPRRLLVLDRALLAEADPCLRFLFGYTFDAIRGGYALLLQLGARQRRELALLLRGLLAPENERPGQAAEIARGASRRAAKVLERYAGRGREVDPDAWIDGMLASAKRAGVLACDDFAAAVWMVARLAGEQLASHDATVALGAVLGGADLVRFYLSDDYQRLRDLLTIPA